MLVQYNNGQEVFLQEGVVFYLPPAHTGIIEEDVKLPDCSIISECSEVMEYIGKKMAAITE